MAADRYFVSFSGADRRWAEWIATEIAAIGAEVILDQWDFAPGDNFVARIHEALQDADVLVAVLSRNYLGSRYAEMEWTAALADPRMRVLPVRVDDVSPPGLFGSLVYVDLGSLGDAAAQRALRSAIERLGGDRRAFIGSSDSRPPRSPASDVRPAPRRPARPELLQRLRAVLRSTDIPVMVTGPPNSGAEALLREAVDAEFGGQRGVLIAAIRPDDAELAVRSLLRRLRELTAGETPPEGGLDDFSPIAPVAALGDLAQLLSDEVVLTVVEAQRLTPAELEALVSRFRGRLLALAAEGAMPRVSGVERFAVAPMKRDEAEHYIATIAHDRYARSVDPVVLDHLSPELWSLPGVVDVLLPSLLDVTPDLGVWLPDHPEVRNVELALRAFVGQLDPAERRLLSALAVAPTTDQRTAIEATGVPEPLEQLLDLVRRGLLVREANAFGVPAVLRAQLPRSDLQACFDELSRRELEHLAADGAGKRLGHLVSVAASEYDLDLDLATLSSAGVLDALNADGQWGSYLMVLDLALANPTEATDRADLRLRRIRKRIQLGHLAEAGSDLAAFEKSAHHPTELIDAHSHRALLLFATGDYVAALGSIAEAQGLAEEEGDQARLAKVANLTGNLLVAHGTPRLALEAFDSARRFARKAQDPVAELDAEIGYINAAVIAGEAVDVEAALDGLGEACLAGGRRTQLARLHYLAAQQLETEAPEDARAHAELARQWSDGGSVIFALAEGLLDRLHRASPHTREEGEA